MKVAIGSDHRGFLQKEKLKNYLEELGYEISDEGTYSKESADYPVFAGKVARKVSGGAADRGVLICGSGIGMCIAANKFKGIRAAFARSVWDAEMSRKHNDANIICMGADATDYEDVKKITEVFLTAVFEGGRHQKRLDIIEGFEK